MSGKADEEFSCLLCTTLDMLGYQLESVQFRSEVIDHITACCSRDGKLYSFASVGSSGEGVALADSDLDKMVILEDTICVEKASYQNQLNILEADNTACPPGYTKIVSAYMYFNQGSVMFGFLKSSLRYTNQTGCPYISSAVFRNCFHLTCLHWQSEYIDGKELVQVTNNGPAATRILPLGEEDIVPSIYFFGSKHLIQWANRVRFSTWPSAELVNEISQMEGYVVPVGNKCSDNQCLEWRICYTSAEKKLVSSLNDVQVKFYILLKLIGKKILKPVCKDITSYIVKNTVFWVVETESVNSFSPCLLLKLVQKSLFFIKYCLENNHFPNYMIPDRNLLTGVSGKNKIKVIQFLSECLKDVKATVLRVQKLNEYMYGNYSSLERTAYSNWRNEAEKKLLKTVAQFIEHRSDPSMMFKHTSKHGMIAECLRDERIVGKCMEMINMLVPEWFQLSLEGRIEEIVQLFIFRLKALTPL